MCDESGTTCRPSGGLCCRRRPGAYFGELALLHGGCRAATVVAATDVSLLTLARRDFAQLLGPLQAKLEQQAADYAPLPAQPQQQLKQPQVLVAHCVLSAAGSMQAADAGQKNMRFCFGTL